MTTLIQTIAARLGITGTPDELLARQPEDLATWVRSAPVADVRRLLDHALDLARQYGEASQARLRAVREAEMQHDADHADDGAQPTPLDQRTLTRINEDFDARWKSDLHRYGWGFRGLTPRISVLRDALSARRAFDAELAPMLDRARTLALAVYEAGEALQAHARKVDSLGKLANISDHKATQSLRAKCEAAERELETARAEVRGLDPDAA